MHAIEARLQQLPHVSKLRPTVCESTMSMRVCFFFSSRRRHTRSLCDWSSDVCSSDLASSGDDLSFETGSGDVDVALVATFRSVHIETGSGDVRLKVPPTVGAEVDLDRSEERRVGKEGRSRWSPYH